MKNGSRHIIQRASIKLAAGDNPRFAQQASESVSETIKRLSSSTLENLFDEFSAGEHLQIDRLEIDLGNINLPDFESELIKQLRLRLQEISTGSAGAEPGVECLPAPNRHKKELWFFLEKGRRPWYIPSSVTSRAFQEQLMETLVLMLREDPETLRNFLLPRLKNKHLLNRVITLLGQDVKPLFRAFCPPVAGELIRVAKLLDRTTPGITTGQRNRSLLVAAVLQSDKNLPDRFIAALLIQFASHSGDPGWLMKLSQQITKEQPSTGVKAIQEFAARLQTYINSVAVSRSDRELKHVLKSILKGTFTEEQIRHFFPSGSTTEYPSKSETGDLSDFENDQTLGGTEKEETGLKQEKPGRDDDTMWVGNAGIILVWPFLPALFKNLELVYEGRFLDDAARDKSVLILDYLSYGSQESGIPEDRLVLSKLLCNVPVDDTVDLSRKPGSSAQNACNEMLETVIGHWSVLKNSSPDGIKQSFFLRRGRIHEHAGENKFSLTIERQSIDVLVDRVPWPLSVVRLPWMNKIIHVEW